MTTYFVIFTGFIRRCCRFVRSVNAATTNFADECVIENVAVTVTWSGYVADITQSVPQNFIDDTIAGYSVDIDL